MSGERRISSQAPIAIAGRVTRTILLILSLALVAWAFARVGVREIFHGDGTKGKTELVVMHWSGDGGPAEDAIVDRALARFEEANPDIQVTRLNPGRCGFLLYEVADHDGCRFIRRTSSTSGRNDWRPMPMPACSLSLDERTNSNSTAEDFNLQDFYPSTVDAFRFEDGQVGSRFTLGNPEGLYDRWVLLQP